MRGVCCGLSWKCASRTGVPVEVGIVGVGTGGLSPAYARAGLHIWASTLWVLVLFVTTESLADMCSGRRVDCLLIDRFECSWNSMPFLRRRSLMKRNNKIKMIRPATPRPTLIPIIAVLERPESLPLLLSPCKLLESPLDQVEMAYLVELSVPVPVGNAAETDEVDVADRVPLAAACWSQIRSTVAFIPIIQNNPSAYMAPTARKSEAYY